MRNPTFEQCLAKMKEVHERKNSDYSNLKDPYSNFKYAAALAEPFTDPVDKVFAVLLGIKLARLAELRKPGRVPKNEPIEDTFLDNSNYSVIWWSYFNELQRVSKGSKGNKRISRRVFDHLSNTRISKRSRRSSRQSKEAFERWYLGSRTTGKSK